MNLSGNTYLITYDLHRQRDYSRLYQLFGSWRAVPVTESNWIAQLVGPAHVIRDLVRGVLDNDDSVAVYQLPHGSDWAVAQINTTAIASLSANVTPAKMAA